MASPLLADVIILKDGTIYLGDIKSVSSDGIVIESFGTTRTLSQKEILKSSKNMTAIQEVVAEIKLKNASVMKGVIQNYDDEVGLLLKTDYGSITMPAKGIAYIHDGSQKRKYYGPPAVVGVMMGCYFPVGAFKDRFHIQPLLSAFAEINSVFARGLYFGIDAGYMFMKYRPDRSVKFDGGTLKVYAQYRFLDLRILSSPARYLSPFIAAGAGISYIARRDNRDLSFGPTRKNEIDALYSVGFGLDVFATESIVVRAQCSWMGLQQKKALMNAFSTTVGIMWCF
jgi:small nuclear ribonucleoprotein (snRNP)-like protein